jgi:hypothetical protein
MNVSILTPWYQGGALVAHDVGGVANGSGFHEYTHSIFYNQGYTSAVMLLNEGRVGHLGRR